MSNDLLDENEIQQLKTLVKGYDKSLSNWEKDIVLGGKTIEKVNAEQPKLVAKYVKIKLELYALQNFAEQQVKIAKALSLKNYFQFTQKSLGERMVEKIVEEDKKYCEIYMLYLEIHERYEKARQIVEQFNLRAYSINNIVKARIAAVEDQTIRDDDE